MALNWRYELYGGKDAHVHYKGSSKSKSELKATIKEHRAAGVNRSISPVESWVFDSVRDETPDIKRLTIHIRQVKKLEMVE